jgi:hypothetical protein
MPVGVTVSAVEIPPAITSNWNTTNQFIVGFTDGGPVGVPIAVTTLANVSAIGAPNGSINPYNSRDAGCASVFDAIDKTLREDGSASPMIYVSRVVHGTPASASITLAPSAALTLTAKYVGAGGNGIYVAVANNTTYYTLSLQDSAGNVLVTSPQLTTLAAGVAWCATTGYVTAVSSGSTLPSTAAATAMSGGADNHASATLTDIQNALAAFSPVLGPGQVMAPGMTNTTYSGLWSALATHASTNNRVAIGSMDDNQPAATEVTDLGTLGASGVGTYIGMWAGNRNVPGIASGTTRSLSPDSTIAGLISRADTATGNVNTAAAGIKYPPAYDLGPTSLVSGSPFDTYSNTDLQTLNAAGINTFQTIDGVGCNYGFVTPVLMTADGIYWQFNHSRLRMWIVAQAQTIGQNYMFGQIDGQQGLQNAFATALEGMLDPLWRAGALYGATGLGGAYAVDTGSDINTPATMAAGQLNALLTVSFSYFAQNVQVTVNVVPIGTPV